MKKKLIIINGIMGVGKTTISKELNKSLENSFLLEGDSCWRMNPFVVNEENRAMVIDNVCFMINSFLKNSSTKYVIFNWVIYKDSIMNDIISKVDTDDVEVYKITIMCSREELVRRIIKDINAGIRNEECIRRSLGGYSLYENMDTIKLDTTRSKIEETVEKIKEIIK